MIKSLRKKFILVNMLLVFVVLTAVFMGSCVSGYRSLVSDSRRELEMALSRMDDQQRPSRAIGENPVEEFNRSPILVLRAVNGGAEVVLSDGISVTGEEAELVAKAALSSGDNGGVLREYNLRYLVQTERGETRIAFIDIYNEQVSLRNTILTSVLSMAGAMAAFFVVSLFLSRWALLPVERAWEQQRRFIADASHELKTPLTVILANAGILKENRADTVENQMRWVENTITEAGRMRSLVDNLLFLAKADDAQQRLRYAEMSLSDAVYRTALTFEALAFERGVTLDTAGVREGVDIIGDEAQIKQLLGTLTDNAIKYSEHGGTVALRLKANQSYAVLTVHNMGELLSAEDAENVFERFYRADKSRAREGYGLGLAIAKSIVDAHHGRISALSGEGRGTTFTVELSLRAGIGSSR